MGPLFYSSCQDHPTLNVPPGEAKDMAGDTTFCSVTDLGPQAYPWHCSKVKKIIKQREIDQDQVMPANASHMVQSSGSGLVTLKCNRFLISLQVAFLEFFPVKDCIRIGHIGRLL